MTAEERRLRVLLAETLETWDGSNPDLYDRIKNALEVPEASKRGKSNRRRGHTAERDVCAWLRGHGFPDAATTRSLLGSDGTRQPGDVSFAPGVVLSVKHVKTPAWPAWLREVKDEAMEAGGWRPGFSPRVPAVVHRTSGQTDVGKWPCAVPLSYWDDMFAVAAYDRPIGDYARLLHMFGVNWRGKGWVEHCVPNRPHVAVMRFERFVQAFELAS